MALILCSDYFGKSFSDNFFIFDKQTSFFVIGSGEAAQSEAIFGWSAWIFFMLFFLLFLGSDSRTVGVSW